MLLSIAEVSFLWLPADLLQQLRGKEEEGEGEGEGESG